MSHFIRCSGHNVCRQAYQCRVRVILGRSDALATMFAGKPTNVGLGSYWDGQMLWPQYLQASLPALGWGHMGTVRCSGHNVCRQAYQHWVGVIWGRSDALATIFAGKPTSIGLGSYGDGQMLWPQCLQASLPVSG